MEIDGIYILLRIEMGAEFIKRLYLNRREFPTEMGLPPPKKNTKSYRCKTYPGALSPPPPSQLLGRRKQNSL